MFEISFEINGKKVRPNQIGDMLEAAMLEQIQDSIKKAVGSAHCRRHGGRPKVIVKGRNLDNLSFEVSGCCEELIDDVQKKLK